MAISIAPSQFYVQQADGRVLVSWSPISAVDNYILKRSVDGGVTYSTINSPAAGVTEYLDEAVTVGVTYWYKIAAVVSGDTGLYTSALPTVPTLPGEMTLGALRLYAQQKADRVGSQFITLPEWNTYINQSYFALYDLLIQKYGNEYYVAEPLQVTTDGSGNIDLPNGYNHAAAPAFYKLLGLDLGLNSGNNAWITLKKFMFIQRNNYIYPQITANGLGIAGFRYRMIGNKINCIPTPSAGQILRIWYIPRMTSLLSDQDLVDGVSGWTEWIALNAAIMALTKEESDTQALLLEREKVEKRIEAVSENRDAGEPEVISNTRRVSDWYGAGTNGSDGPVGGY